MELQRWQLAEMTQAEPVLSPAANLARPARWQVAAAARASALLQMLNRAARHKALVCISMAALPMIIRLAVLHYVPIPQPSVHDEFSYILAADTFRSGRLTNPPHPMWEHFETFHELMQPTYQSKYPPAQGMFLALGWKVFGNPWYGVCITFGLMCGCLCWMLQGWMPPVYAMLGTLVAMGQIGIFGYWMDSYWGGAVAAAGGALALGALPRLAHRASTAVSALGTVGVALLANSRPYEGLMMLIAAAVALLWWRRRMGRRLTELFSWRNLVPFLLIGGCVATWMAYYNYRVTGKPWKLPYMAYEDTYAMVPQWVILPPIKHPPHFRHEVLKQFWTEEEAPQYIGARHNPFRAAVKSLHDALPFFFSTLSFALVAAALLISQSPKLWLAAGIGAMLWLASLLELWYFPHYLAGGTGLVFVIAMFGMRLLRVTSRRVGALILLLVAATPFLHGLSQIVAAHDGAGRPKPRLAVTRSLLATGGRHLVFVRYSRDHDIYGLEWVFNAANIDSSPIVWARDMGVEKNKELLSYYPDRKAWLLKPEPTPTLTLYAR